MTNSILQFSAGELGRKIKQREISSFEVVKTHIDIAKKKNPSINAIVRERYDIALYEARKYDILLSQNSQELPIYFGVPCTIKENFAFKGFPQTGGLFYRKNFIARENATAVDRILNSGAIVIGTTNVSELCMWMESNNKVYGRTNNPYDTRRIVGGSSGGEGAIIGSGASPFGLGADIGGSIRMPAFFNGIFGHKPSGGLVPGSGQYPMASGPALRYLTTGPLCRRAEDLKPLLKILKGPDGIDTGTTEISIDWEEKLDFSKLEIINIFENGSIPVSNELKNAQKRVYDFLIRMGATEKKVNLPELKHSFEIWSSMLALAGGPSFEDLLFQGRDFHLPIEFLKSLVGFSEFTIPGLGLAAFEKIPKYFPSNSKKYLEIGYELKHKLHESLRDNTILLYPSYSCTAPYHNEPILKTFDWVYTAIINVMELPSTQVPLGLSTDGLPLGIQIISNHGRDVLSINVAETLEKEFGGWINPDNQ